MKSSPSAIRSTKQFPDWGSSSYFTVQLSGEVRLQDLLTHIYVLVPVLDNEKHYWVGDDEVEKLLRHGSGWLSAHPEREEITRRYLKYRRDLARDALARLTQEEAPDVDITGAVRDSEEEAVEKTLNLNEQRLNTVVAALKSANAKRVLDLGCGEGKLLRVLLADRSFDEIVGVDVSHRALELAQERLRLERLPDRQRQRLKLMHGSLMYRDRRLSGFDAAAVIEVIEHLDRPRLAAFERVLFEFAKPETIVLTTPNVEYNARFENLPAGKFRHKDHRFEWTRAEFHDWSQTMARAIRLCGPLSAGRPGRQCARRPDADGGFQHRNRQREHNYDSRARAGRARRPIGLWQVDVCAASISNLPKYCRLTSAARWCPTTRTIRRRPKTRLQCCTLSPRSDSPRANSRSLTRRTSSRKHANRWLPSRASIT